MGYLGQVHGRRFSVFRGSRQVRSAHQFWFFHGNDRPLGSGDVFPEFPLI